MNDLRETPVVTCFLRHRGEVLLLRRSGEVGSYRGLWGGVAGHAEGDPDAAALTEIEEETGLDRDAVTLVRAGEPFPVEDDDLGKRWIVHPYLFDCDSREVELDWESTEAEWVAPPEILRRDTVPELWTSYRRVAPTVDSVAGDREHGSAWVSLRALEVLRDRAGLLAHRRESGSGGGRSSHELKELARRLLDARRSMAALANRVHRAMAEGLAAAALADEPDAALPAALEAAAHRGIARALGVDAAAARQAARRVAGSTVLTLSRSGTVTDALLAADPPPRVWVAESGPQREGVEVARRLAAAGMKVTLIADAAIAAAVAGELGGGPNLDLVLVGADTLLPEGTVVNKVGSAAAALAARRVDVPFYAVAATDKLDPDGAFRSEDGDPDDLLRRREGKPEPQRWVPLFEPVLSDLVSGILTEDGLLDPPRLAEVADELAELRSWLEGPGPG